MRTPRKHRPTMVLGIAAALSFSSARATDFVRIDHPSFDAVEAEAFRLRRPLTVGVHCEGAGDPGDGEMFAYGWILNLRTRRTEWVLTRENSRSGAGDNYVFEGEVELPAGDFVAYFAPFTHRYKSIRMFGREYGRIYVPRHKSRSSKRWGLRLSTLRDADLELVETLEYPVQSEDPLRFVDIVRVGDDAYEARGFTLPERMQITVYCQGECADVEDGPVDLGWILNADTRQRVWVFGPDNFEHGGGSSKNKVSRETITIPAGNYIASYATDGSHSYAGWNDPPPHDPDGWGLLLWAQSARDAARIRPYTEQEDPRLTLLALIRQRDDALVSQGFTLKRDARVRVYAIGEYDESSDEFADSGWIEEFGSDRSVWSMRRANTHPAGGAHKNRMADETIALKRGSYVAYYATDGTHAYKSWNSTPPNDPEHWGITLMGTGPDFGPSQFELFDAEARREAGKEYLVRLVRVGSDRHERQRFKLDTPTRVRIFAVGEGSFDEMYDYGWIEAVRSGSWVWEMTWRNTRPAGGAEKNRLFDRSLLLDAGEYEAHFVTDGSHAWKDWNDTRPRDPNAWGLTVTRAGPD